MDDDVYKKLCAEMARRGGRYPGKDIPEFYDLTKELFTPEEAAAAAASAPQDAPWRPLPWLKKRNFRSRPQIGRS
jgi:hypothetical protein